MGDGKDITKKSILIVDDSSTMRRILRLTLGKCGFNTVEEGQNGVDGLTKARQKQFDCVITDWNMPEMDGLQLVQELRKIPSYAHVPIMMCTTEGGKEEVVEALTNGVSSYIVKPFTEEILRRKMEAIFGG